MRVLPCRAVLLLLIGTVAAVPVQTIPAQFEVIGPPTRAQRLSEGWIDEEAKYFHEPGHDDKLGHYDARFFQRIVTEQERSDALQHMIRAYLDFFRIQELETWIAHGTLLGWWWNGQILPWDWDIDTQVSDVTLRTLATSYNQTRHQHIVGELGDRREYLLDVNPMSDDRSRGDGMNVIDARWIDTRTGLYIDITALSETEPLLHPGVLSCKNLHHYGMREIYPLRETTFEGVPARVPNAFDQLLRKEYKSKSLMLTQYEGHYWDTWKRLWLKRPINKPLRDVLPVDTVIGLRAAHDGRSE